MYFADQQPSSAHMRRGWLATLRTWQRAIIHSMIAVLMLPLLLGILVQPIPPAEAALLRDIGQSICSPGGGGPSSGDQRRQGEHHYTCILCPTGCSSNPLPTPATGFISFPLALRKQLLSNLPAIQTDPISSRPVLLDGTPPRGPPGALLI
jgi:hypothetical protein